MTVIVHFTKLGQKLKEKSVITGLESTSEIAKVIKVAQLLCFATDCYHFTSKGQAQYE